MFGDVPDPPSIAYLLGLVAVGTSVAGGMSAMAVPAARRYVYPEYKETRLRDHILFDRVLDDGITVQCTNGSMFQVVSVPGIDLNARSIEEQDNLFQVRRAWLEGLVKWPVEVRVITSRTLHDHAADVEAYDNIWLKEAQKRWHGTFSRSYRNAHHVVLSVKAGSTRGRDQLNEATVHTLEQLREFKAETLQLGNRSDERSPLLSFLGSLLNPCREVSIGAWDGVPARKEAGATIYGSIDERLADHLIGSEIYFRDGFGNYRDDGIATFRDGPNEVWMAGVGVGAWGATSSADILQTVLSVDAEMTVSHWVKVFDSVEAQKMLEDLLKRGVGAQTDKLTGVDAEMVQQFSIALKLIEGQASNRGMALTLHQMCVFVYGTSREDLEHRVKLVQRAFRAYQVKTSRETGSCEPLWFSMFPPHLEWVRGTRLMSANPAHFIELSSPSQGLDRCEFGPRPVQTFRTSRGSPYGFTFQTSAAPLAIGNVAVFGGSNAGKTTIKNWVVSSAMGYQDARAFMLDRFDGSYVMTKAFGGRYLDPMTSNSEVGDTCEINPLMMDLSGRNSDRQWLLRWLMDFVCGVDDQMSENYLLGSLKSLDGKDPKIRRLETIWEGLPDNVMAKAQLARWVGDGAYAHLYNGARDTLSFGSERLVAFDVTTALEDPDTARTLIPYLAYRIETECQRNGVPWILDFDETHALLASGEAFRKWYLKGLQEVRKQRGVLISCFQRVSTLNEFGITEALKVLCPTYIILPNPQADEAEYIEILGCTRKEFQLINKTDPLTRAMQRFALVKREGEGSVLLDVDLSPLGPYLDLFQSGAKPANRLRQLEREEGNIDRAVERYLGLKPRIIPVRK